MHALNNHLFWKKKSSETVAVLKKYLSLRSNWLEKVLLTRSTYKKEVAAPDNLVFWKKSLFKNLSFHFNQCCPGNIVVLMISLFHCDWCPELCWKKVRLPNWIAVNFNIRKMHSTVKRMNAWQKQMHYFKGRMVAIRVVKYVDWP